MAVRPDDRVGLVGHTLRRLNESSPYNVAFYSSGPGGV